MAANSSEQEFLRPPSTQQYELSHRNSSIYNPLNTFRLPPGQERQYQQQYGDMYFLRLAKLKPAVEAVAVEAWEGFSIAGEHARRVERVLDVRQGELCWVAGTIYMEMPLKPNILDDLAKDNFTSAPPPRRTYQDPAHPELTEIMLEDESGRLRLTGSKLQSVQLATGVIIAVLGTENANGDFEAIDIKVPDLARQPRRWERDEAKAPKEAKKGKIAMVSGLGITGTSSDTLALELLTDYLLGYTGSSKGEEGSPPDASRITRLIIAGNSLGASTIEAAPATDGVPAKKIAHQKKYGYDASAYNASPITQLDSFLAELLPSIPITLMPGESDPANFALPQQPIHRAMFPRSRAYCSAPPIGEDKVEPGWFDSVTNPWEGNKASQRSIDTLSLVELKYVCIISRNCSSGQILHTARSDHSSQPASKSKAHLDTMTIPLQTITSLRTTFNPFARSSRPCRLLLSLIRNPSTTPVSSPTHIDIKVEQLPRTSTKEPEITVGFKGGKEVKLEVGKRQMKIGDVVEEIARVGRAIEREESLKG